MGISKNSIDSGNSETHKHLNQDSAIIKLVRVHKIVLQRQNWIFFSMEPEVGFIKPAKMRLNLIWTCIVYGRSVGNPR